MHTYNKIENGIELTPEAPALSSIIWLHGLGADGNDFVPIVPELQLPENWPIRFIFPNAPLRPVTINNGYVMRAWFDITSINIDQGIDYAGIASSVKSVEQWIEREQQRGISAEKIILAGFSQGAVIALTTGLRYPKRLGGILALSGCITDDKKLIAEKNPVNQNTPIFVAHGTRDEIIPFALGQRLADFLKTQGYPVTWHRYAMPHSVCAEEIRDIALWLKKINSPLTQSQLLK